MFDEFLRVLSEEWERRGMHIGYWWEINRERGH
jgi:hypothetical protein